MCFIFLGKGSKIQKIPLSAEPLFPSFLDNGSGTILSRNFIKYNRMWHLRSVFVFVWKVLWHTCCFLEGICGLPELFFVWYSVVFVLGYWFLTLSFSFCSKDITIWKLCLFYGITIMTDYLTYIWEFCIRILY